MATRLAQSTPGSETRASGAAPQLAFEGLVIEELAGLAAEHAVRPELFFWRTSPSAEVDLLIRDGRYAIGTNIDVVPWAEVVQWQFDFGLGARRGR